MGPYKELLGLVLSPCLETPLDPSPDRCSFPLGLCLIPVRYLSRKLACN